jgi:hypothetical protein
MSNKKMTANALLVVGIVLFLLSLLADRIGIGVPGFGTRQIIGTILGVLITLVGLVLTLRK